MRRMKDEICRKNQVRPHMVAEINAIETLLRSLAPLQAATLMPKIALRERESLKLRAIRLQGKKLGVDIGLRSEEHTSEFQSLAYLVCRLLLEKKKTHTQHTTTSLHTPPQPHHIPPH